MFQVVSIVAINIFDTNIVHPIKFKPNKSFILARDKTLDSCDKRASYLCYQTASLPHLSLLLSLFPFCPHCRCRSSLLGPHLSVNYNAFCMASQWRGWSLFKKKKVSFLLDRIFVFRANAAFGLSGRLSVSNGGE